MKIFHIAPPNGSIFLEEIKSLILSGYFKEFVTDISQAKKFIEQDKGKHVLRPPLSMRNLGI